MQCPLKYKYRRLLQLSDNHLRQFILVPNYPLMPTGSRYERGPKGLFTMLLREGWSLISGIIVSPSLQS